MINKFYKHVIAKQIGNHFSFDSFFENVFSEDYPFIHFLPVLLSSGSATVSAPFSFTLKDWNVFCMIHSLSGTGHIKTTQQEFHLPAHSFTLLDCNEQTIISCLQNRWNFEICFLSVHFCNDYYSLLTNENRQPVFDFSKYIDCYELWNHFFQNTLHDVISTNMRCQDLFFFFNSLYATTLKECTDSPHIPKYLNLIHQQLTDHYVDNYDLDYLSAKARVSKYKLCRDFKKFYNTSPMQYLIDIRLTHAKKYLVETDYKIIKISQLVGYENVNQFIRLFKDKTGVTPLIYREMS